MRTETDPVTGTHTAGCSGRVEKRCGWWYKWQLGEGGSLHGEQRIRGRLV